MSDRLCIRGAQPRLSNLKTWDDDIMIFAGRNLPMMMRKGVEIVYQGAMKRRNVP